MNDVNFYSWTKKWALLAQLKLWSEEVISSTNAVAKNDTSPASRPQIDNGAISDPSLYITTKQTEGRGRGGNKWLALEGSSLLSSWSFALNRAPQPISSPLAGLALYEAAVATWPDIPFNLKAPNDLYIGDKKVAGLLIELVDQGSEKRLVVGLGLNVSAAPEGIATATYLGLHLHEALTEEKWRAFMSAWLLRLKSAVHEGIRDMISPAACERLRVALNLHPLLKEPIVKVDELGQLHFPTRTIHWHEM